MSLYASRLGHPYEMRELQGDFGDLVETLPHGIQLTDASGIITLLQGPTIPKGP